MPLATLKHGRHALALSRSLQTALLYESSRTLHSTPEQFLLEHSCDLTPSMVVQFIEKQRNPDVAYRLFSLASQQTGYRHNEVAFSALLNSLCKFKQFDLLPTVLGNMIGQRCPVKDSTLAFVLKSLSNSGMIQASCILLKKLISLGFQLSHRTYGSIIWRLVKADELDMAMQLIEQLKDADFYVDCILVGMITNALCKAGKADMAVRLLESVAVKMPGSIDRLSLHGVVGCLCDEGRPLEALKLIEDMKTFDVFPDIVAYNKLMTGLCCLGQIDDALHVSSSMAKDSVTPNSVSLNILLNGLCKKHRVDEAILLFRRMGSMVGTDSQSYNILVHALCNQTRIQEAWDLASEMVRKAIPFTIHYYHALAVGFLRINEGGKALSLLQEMLTKGVRSDARLYGSLIIWLCRKGKVDRALELLEKLVDNGSALDQKSFRSIISGLCKTNKVLEALELGYEMMRNDRQWNLDVLTPVLETLCKLGQKEKAYNLLDVLVDMGAVPTRCTYYAMLRGFCIAKRFDNVRNVLAEMKENSFDPDLTTYAIMIYANAHHVSGTVDLFSPLIGSNIVLSTGNYVSLLDGLFQTGEVEFAMKVLTDMQKAEFKFHTSVFNVVIDGLCKNHRVNAAQEYFVKMRGCGCSPDHVTYTSLMYGYCGEGRFDVLNLFYREMQADGCKPDILTYRALLLGFARGEKFKEFYSVLEDMKAQGCPPEESLLDSVFPCLRHKDQKRVRNFLKKEFGIAYDPKLLDIIENDKKDKTGGLPNEIGRRTKQYEDGGTQKLLGSDILPNCGIIGNLDGDVKDKALENPKSKKSVTAPSTTKQVVGKFAKTEVVALRGLSSHRPRQTNKLNVKGCSKIKEPVNQKKNSLSKVLNEEYYGQGRKQIIGNKLSQNNRCSPGLNKRKAYGKVKLEAKGSEFGIQRGSQSTQQKGSNMV